MMTIKSLFGALTITAALAMQVHAQPQFTNLITTLTMTFEQAQNLATPVLPLGGSYFFRATGRYGTGPGDRGEAMADAAWGTVITSTLDEYHNPGCGWRWNGTSTNRPSPDDYQSNHVYNFYFVGRGAAEVLTFTDSYYADNVGTLTFQLYEITQDPFKNGLVAYYPFNGNANDESGNGNNGTLVGNDRKFLADRFGQPQSSLFLNTTSTPAWTLDGAYVSAPRSAALDFSGDFTLSVWVNISSGVTNLNEYFISNGNDGAGSRRIGLAIGCASPVYGGNDLLSCAWGAGGAGYVAAPVRNSWWQFAAIRSGTNLTLFKNGSAITNNVITVSPVNSPMIWFGRFQPVPSGNENTWPLIGGIDDVRMYNRALSSAEIQQLYLYESGPQVGLIKAVKPSFSYLAVGTNYQLQLSADMNTWTNYGSPFTATNLNMVYPQYWDVDNWGKLFFRVQVAP